MFIIQRKINVKPIREILITVAAIVEVHVYFSNLLANKMYNPTYVNVHDFILFSKCLFFLVISKGVRR